MNRETATRIDRAENLPVLHVLIEDRRPSWQLHGTGFAEIRLDTCKGRPWLTIDVLESGEKSSRRTIVTINEESNRKLFAMLSSVFNPPTTQGNENERDHDTPGHPEKAQP